MNRERLGRLVELMEEVEAAGRMFDLTRWLMPGDEVSSTTSGVREVCGTAACALGYAALDPSFQAEGLRFEATWHSEGRQRRFLISAGEFIAISKEIGEDHQLHFYPTFEGAEAFNAGAKFFGITPRAAAYLFDPNTYDDNETQPIPPSMVAERIREVIDHDGNRPPHDDGDDGDDGEPMDGSEDSLDEELTTQEGHPT